MNGIFHLKGTVKHYDWGGFFFLPALLKQPNEDKKPFAEYWLGTHPQGPARLQEEGKDSSTLKVKAGDLSYLFKVLDVKDMLSIQVHPTAEAARAGFERENKAGIPPDAPERSFRDPHAKPELMVALSDFWLLQGFKPAEELSDILLNVTELNALLPVFSQQGYEGLYKRVMEMPQGGVNRLLQPLIDKILPLYLEDKLHKDSEDFWAARAAQKFSSQGDIDRGIFSIYFFNLIELKKREGLFQAPGVPHAYLEGQNVEIMASSDNVLRGGLTSKHVDVEELMKHIRCEAHYPRIITPRTSYGEKIYKTPATEFQLSVFDMAPGTVYEFEPQGPEILLVTEGNATVTDGKEILELAPGQPSAIIFPGNKIRLSTTARATVFRATTPVGD